ncbi:MAG: hypothetical protein ACYC3W_11340 [Candidatus Nanopelagicales bacterium]
MIAIQKEQVLLIESELANNFDQLASIQNEIRRKLAQYSTEKNLKGYEVVGWLGEIYIKILFNGKLVSDIYEHDVELVTGERISVKTRKGRNLGWNNTSLIPRIIGDNLPTNLAFINLDDNYRINKIWLFPWEYLYLNNRFIEKKVRGQLRGFIVKIDEVKDKTFEIIIK